MTRPNIISRFIKFLLSFILGLLLVIALTLGTLIFFSEKIVTSVASYYVNEKTGYDLSFGETHVQPLRGNLSFKEVQLTNPSYFADPHFLSLKELSISLSPISLIEKKNIVNHIHLSIEKATWVKMPTDKNNISEFSKPFSEDKPAKNTTTSSSKKSTSAPENKKPSEPIQFLIKELKIEVGTVVIADYSKKNPSIKEVPINYSRTFTNITKTSDVTGPLLADFTKIGVAFIMQSYLNEVITAPFQILQNLGTTAAPEVLQGTVEKTKDIGSSLKQGVGNLFESLKPKE